MDFYSRKELEESNFDLIEANNKNIEVVIAKTNLNSNLWVTFIILTLIFLLFEIFLIKLLKK